MRCALILGIGGQDGSYLADLLVSKGYEVHGVYRHSSGDNLWRINHLKGLCNVLLHAGDILDPSCIRRIVREVQPSEIYNEADQDSVPYSYETPLYSMDVTAKAVVNLLEIVRRDCPAAKVFQPLSATMFGVSPPPQNESTPFAPQSPYAIAKVAAYYACQHYRREYALHIYTGIFYNHESPRRRGDYLLQRICREALAISKDKHRVLKLWDIESQVDIGYAPEYMDAAWRILQLEEPMDLVIGTGRGVSIAEFVNHAFQYLGIDSGRVQVDHTTVRKGPRSTLIANCEKAQKLIDWYPATKPPTLVKHILDNMRRRESNGP